jgi:hypothetical protein
MATAKIMMSITRGIDYSTFSDKFRYRATVRVYVRRSPHATKDIAYVRIRADSRNNLEEKIKSVRGHFSELLKKDPDYVSRIGVPERFSLGETE